MRTSTSSSRLDGALHPYAGQSAWTLLEERVHRSGDATAFTWHPYAREAEPERWTYAALRRTAASVGAGLQQLGVERGDRVVIHLENCPEHLVAWFGCAAIGAVAVTTNSRSAEDELRYYVEKARPAVVITQPSLAAIAAGCTGGSLPLVITDHDAGVPSAAPVGAEAVRFWDLAVGPGNLRPAVPDPWAPMSVQFTSGTTARPKGVVWTHGNVLWAAHQNALRQGLRPDDCTLCYLPLFHINAMAITMLASMWVGARFVLVPKWSTSRFAELSLEHGCTHMNLIGLTGGVLLANGLPEGHSYRMLGAGMCDLGWDEPFGVKSLGWWGMTETVSLPICGDPHTPNRHGSLGRPTAGYDLRVVRDDGTPVAAEETGHLQVRGVPGLSLFAEYLFDPEATAAAFDADWFRTGDLATVHADGYVTFAERAKDVLRVGAENVSAAEVERVLLEVEGVVEAAVVGRPDDKLDEVPVGFVRTAGTRPGIAEAAMLLCSERLADFKVPRAVYVVQELPRSTLSKVNKVALRAVAHEDADRAGAEATWLAAAATDPSGTAA